MSVCSGFFLFFSPGIQISLAELQSLLHELEGQNEVQAANIESLTATLTTKDEIIAVGTLYLQHYEKIMHPIANICVLC